MASIRLSKLFRLCGHIQVFRSAEWNSLLLIVFDDRSDWILWMPFHAVLALPRLPQGGRGLVALLPASLEQMRWCSGRRFKGFRENFSCGASSAPCCGGLNNLFFRSLRRR